MIELSFLISFLVVYISLGWIIERLKKRGLVGRDVNKPDRPVVAEMGGLAILLGVMLSISFVIWLQSWEIVEVDSQHLIVAVLLSILFSGIVGILDDLLDLPKWVKLLLPVAGAVPLIALKALGPSVITIPFIGQVDLGLFYVYVLVPLLITGAANLTNILAGFNGLEYGMALPIFGGMVLLGYLLNKPVIYLYGGVMLAAAIAFLLYNRYPAKVFPGDTGTLVIGTSIMAPLIADNLESYSLVFFLYGLDGIIKILNKLPSKGWWGIYREGKLYAPKRPVGLAQWVMKLFNGISEQDLVRFFIIVQIIITAIVVLLLGWNRWT